MLNLLLLGNTGQFGWELNRTLQPLGKVTALDTSEINMADAESIRAVVREHRPEIIVTATAYRLLLSAVQILLSICYYA